MYLAGWPRARLGSVLRGCRPGPAHMPWVIPCVCVGGGTILNNPLRLEEKGTLTLFNVPTSRIKRCAATGGHQIIPLNQIFKTVTFYIRSPDEIIQIINVGLY